MVLAAMLFSVMAPKAVHAVTITMVDVVEHHIESPTFRRHLLAACQKHSVDLQCLCQRLRHRRAEWHFRRVHSLEVPSGMDFVITDVEITTDGTGSSMATSFSLEWTPPSGKLIGFGWQFLDNSATAEYQFTNGIVILTGSTPTPVFRPSVNFAALRGYLTPN